MRSSPAMTPERPGPAEPLVAALAAGLRHELWLTPKPGLVDRRDAGSHPDLSFELMERSIELVEGYLGELAASTARGEPLAAQVALGQAAEARMLATLGANTHRGAIFLCGLVVAAAGRPGGAGWHATGAAALSGAVARTAEALLAERALPASHGSSARRTFGVGGVVAEARAGLPSVFGVALPAWRAARGRGRGPDEAAFAAMAALMGLVEDTTALHRGGAAGLARVRADGRELARRLLAGEDHLAFLAEANQAWRAERLTMGGVADLLGVTLGLLVHAGELPRAVEH
jgi:triphosphoribosyl-dephospho-CoA synthase